MDLEDKELLRRLLRLLPKVEEDRGGDNTEQPVAPLKLNAMRRSRSEGFIAGLDPNSSRSITRLKETGPLRISRVPKIDLPATFAKFESKCTLLQNKLNQLQKVCRTSAEGDSASKAAAKLSVHFEAVKEYLKQYVDSSVKLESGAPPEVYKLNLASALSALAQSCRTLSGLLAIIPDLVVECNFVQALEDLAQPAESEAKLLRDDHIAGFQCRQRTVDLLLRLTGILDNVTICLAEVIKAVSPAFANRQYRESSKSLAMSCIAILFSIVTAVMLSISIRQGSSALENAVGGFWLVSLVFSVASAITSITILMWWEYASHAGQSISGRALVWLSKGSATLFVTAVVLFSVGLCLFAFSSSQVVAVQAIVIAFTASHYFGLLIVVAWLSRKHQHVKSAIRRFWHSMRRLTQSLIQTSIAPALIDKKDVDVERGLQNSVAAPGDRPVIQVTDTEPVSGIATNDVNFSEVDLGSYSHSNLTVPAARRVSASSESSRSLPGLPGDVQIVRGMRYSPNGMFLCIGNGSPQERCVIFSADSPAIILGELKLSDSAQQIEWSQDGEYILLRLSHTTYIWNAMPSGYARHATIVIHHDADNVKWHPHSDAFLSCKKDILTNFDVQGTPIGIFQIPFALIEDFVFTHDGNHVVCLATVATSVRSGTSTSGARKLIVYDLENKAIAQMVPIGREAHTIVRSIASPEVILVNFAGNTPPQLWQYGQGTPQSEKRASAFGLSFMRAMSFKAPSSDRFYGKGIFGGAEDKLIISVGEEGDMFVFARDSGQLLRHINAPRSSANPKLSAAAQSQPLAHCVAWDPDILSVAICMGFVDGSIWQWKMPFDDLSQNMSTFAVVALDDRDSIMIRAGDRDVKDSVSGGAQ